ncbi:MSCRAMM family protein [Sarcina ventriculi]|uniref:MSCRAMM family protein n=1 Tax=Sarcina ventriculi TaxID=1267 RepID=UPI00073F843C|nr:SpaA isopeptide-forming pilin-related protein [Sarcina ventriculi]
MKKVRRILLCVFLIFCVMGFYIPESNAILYSNNTSFPYNINISLNGQNLNDSKNSISLTNNSLVKISINLTRKANSSINNSNEVVISLPKQFSGMSYIGNTPDFNFSVNGDKLTIKLIDNGYKLVNGSKVPIIGATFNATATFNSNSSNQNISTTINVGGEVIPLVITPQNTNKVNSTSNSDTGNKSIINGSLQYGSLTKKVYNNSTKKWVSSERIENNGGIIKERYELDITTKGDNYTCDDVLDNSAMNYIKNSVEILNSSNQNITKNCLITYSKNIMNIKFPNSGTYIIYYDVDINTSELSNTIGIALSNYAYLYNNINKLIAGNSATIHIEPNSINPAFSKTITSGKSYSKIGDMIDYALYINMKSNYTDIQEVKGIKVIDKLPPDLKIENINDINVNLVSSSSNLNDLGPNVNTIVEQTINVNQTFNEPTVVMNTAGTEIYIYIPDTDDFGYQVNYDAEVTKLESSFTNTASISYDKTIKTSSATAYYSGSQGSFLAYKTVSTNKLTDYDSQNVSYGINVDTYGEETTNNLNITDTLQKGVILNSVNLKGYSAVAKLENGIYIKKEDGFTIKYGLNNNNQYYVKIDNNNNIGKGNNYDFILNTSFSNVPNGTTVNNTAYVNGIPTNTVTTKKGYEIEAIKVSSENLNDTLSGAKYVVYSENGTKITTVESNNTGKIEFSVPKAGEYYLKEIKAPIGYTINTQVGKFEITSNGQIVNETIKDNKIEGTVVITKENEAGTPLAGAKIEIINSANKVVYTGVTNSKGEITDANLPYGTYTYREIAAPTGYTINTQVGKFEITSNRQIINETIKDNKIEGTVVITKENEAGTPLADAKIEIINSANKVVYTGVTNSKGEITDANLPYGTYTYREIAAPTGYTINTQVGKFEITSNGQIVNETIKDKKVTGITNSTGDKKVTNTTNSTGDKKVTDTTNSTGDKKVTDTTNSTGDKKVTDTTNSTGDKKVTNTINSTGDKKVTDTTNSTGDKKVTGTTNSTRDKKVTNTINSTGDKKVTDTTNSTGDKKVTGIKTLPDTGINSYYNILLLIILFIVLLTILIIIFIIKQSKNRSL